MDLTDCLRSEKVALGVCIREQRDLSVVRAIKCVKKERLMYTRETQRINVQSTVPTPDLV